MRTQFDDSLDELWNDLASFVMDNMQEWRQKAVAATGLAFSGVRALKRLATGPKTLGELSEMLTIDAPATTVIVNDLVRRGLAERRPHPTNGRVKFVSLTATGHDCVAKVLAIRGTAPKGMAALSEAELATLGRIIRLIQGTSG